MIPADSATSPPVPSQAKGPTMVPPSPPATKCADCGKPFTGYSQTRWDVRVGGGVWKTVCTSCFEEADARWPEPGPKEMGSAPSKKKKR